MALPLQIRWRTAVPDNLIPMLLGVIGAAVVHYGTAVAPWTFTDGIGYIANGRNLFLGPGLGIVNPSGSFEPLVSHPPLYPVLIAWIEQAGIPIFEAARWINIVSFFLFISSSALFVRRASGSSALGACAAALMIITPGVLLPQLGILSEPLFLSFGFLSLYLSAEYLGSGNRTLLVGSGLSCAIALLTRYPAIVFLATSLILIAVYSGEEPLEKARTLIIVGFIALLPILLLFALNQLLGAGVPKGFSAAEVEQAGSYVKQLIRVIWEWKPIPPVTVLEFLFSPRVAGAFRAVYPVLLTLSLALSSVLVLRRLVTRAKEQGRRMIKGQWLLIALLLFILLYIILYAIAYLFADPTPDVDNRTMLPVLSAGILAIVLVSGVALKGRLATGALGISLALILIGFGIMSFDIAVGLHRTGMGFSSRAWQDSDVVGAAAAISPDRPMLSNVPEALLLYLNRFPYSTESLGPIPSESAEVVLGDGDNHLDTIFREEDSILVLFTNTDLAGVGSDFSSCSDDCSGRSLEELSTEFRGDDGLLLTYPGDS